MKMLVSLVVGAGIGYITSWWFSEKRGDELRRELAELRGNVGDDVDQKIRQWRVAGCIEPVRDTSGEITAIRGTGGVVIQA
jgi:hypothetical protein